MKLIYSFFCLFFLISCDQKAKLNTINTDLEGKYKITEAWFFSSSDSSRKPLPNLESLTSQEILINKKGDYEVFDEGISLQRGKINIGESNRVQIDNINGSYEVDLNGTLHCNLFNITEPGDTLIFSLKPF